MTPDRLSPAFCFKAAGIDKAGVFTGLASTFGGQRDAYGDVIAPGAFADDPGRARQERVHAGAALGARPQRAHRAVG